MTSQQWIFLVLVFSYTCAFPAEEHFLLMNHTTSEAVLQLGMIHKRLSPASTFKIALSLIGYDAGILKDERTPIWNFQDGYVAYKESWKAPQTPQSWMKDSCIWYSQILARELGMDLIKAYLKVLDYGNQDMSGGLTEAWLGSSLKISPAEQVELLRKMIQEDLEMNPRSIQLTKSLLFLKELKGGWKLFGKRGLWASSECIGWFVGWIEKGNNCFLFAYSIEGKEIECRQMTPRTIELLLKSNLIEKNQ